MNNIYAQVYRPDHPRAVGLFIYEHTEIAERALGRYLPPKAHVHHVDGNPRNNTPSNLVICEDGRYHKMLHARARLVRLGINPNTHKWCSTCKKPVLISAFSTCPSTASGLSFKCRPCNAAKQRERKLRRLGVVFDLRLDRAIAALKP